MDRELATALLAGKRLTNRSSDFAIVREDAGTLTRISLTDLKEGTGSFENKAGTIKRSRKGRTYHAPNGYARYARNWEEDVIAYVPKSA